MKFFARGGALLTIFMVAIVPVIADSRIVARWVLTGLPMPKLKQILVITVIDNYLIRQEFEDQMERLLAKSGIEGVPSHMVLPPRNEMLEGELRQRIKEEPTLDAVLVIRPKAVRKETEEVISGGFYVPPPNYYSFWPYWNMASAQFYPTSSYTKENTIVRAECNLYNTKDEKLIWSGETDTVYLKDFQKLGKQYAEMLVKQFKKDKVIGKK
jgi:hypothetical protein